MAEEFFYLGNPSCCCVGCWYVTDQFNRATGTDLGPRWVEWVGDPWIRWQRLYLWIPGQIAIFQERAPRTPTFVTVKLYGMDASAPVTGNAWRVLMNYADDPLSSSGEDGVPYYWAEVKVIDTGASSSGEATGYEISVGTSDGDRTLETRTFLDGMFETGETLQVCFTPAAIVADFDGHYVWSNEIEGLATNPKCGLENSGTGSITFDDLTYGLHAIAISEHDAMCPWCQCRCDDYMPSMTLLCTLTTDPALEAVCPCLEGATVTIEWDDGRTAWYGEAVICGTLSMIEFSCFYSGPHIPPFWPERQFGALTDFGPDTNMCWDDEGDSAVTTIDSCNPFIYQEEICCGGFHFDSSSSSSSGEGGRSSPCNLSCTDCNGGPPRWPAGSCLYFTVTDPP